MQNVYHNISYLRRFSNLSFLSLILRFPITSLGLKGKTNEHALRIREDSIIYIFAVKLVDIYYGMSDSFLHR